MSICERCRAAGEKLYLKGEKCFTPKCPFTRRPYSPGQGGEAKMKSGRRPKRLSDFSRQLSAKQKLKSLYMLRERPLRRLYRMATKKPGQVGELLLRLLELRLDSVVLRSSLESSRGAARQAISHGRVSVNGQMVTTKSYITRVGDTIQVAPASPAGRPLPEAPAWPGKELVPYLEAAGERAVKIVKLPSREEMPSELDENSVIEYLKR